MSKMVMDTHAEEGGDEERQAVNDSRVAEGTERDRDGGQKVIIAATCTARRAGRG